MYLKRKLLSESDQMRNSPHQPPFLFTIYGRILIVTGFKLRIVTVNYTTVPYSFSLPSLIDIYKLKF